MKHLQVKNVPPDLHEAVRMRAANEGMTMSDYVIDLLRRELAIPSRREWIDGLHRREPVNISNEAVAALERGALITGHRAQQAVADLKRAPIRRVPTVHLLPAIWRLRANVSAYDACYVALATMLDCSLVTVNARLTRAPGVGIRVIIP